MATSGLFLWTVMEDKIEIVAVELHPHSPLWAANPPAP
jgi:hypothetical protein